MRFAGRIAVVTGAASGIGKATALRLGREGAAVAAVDRHLAGAEETAAALRNAGSTARAYACDVADSAQVAAAAQAIERDLGPVDVLANVAGIGDAVGTDIAELDDARWNQVLAVNLSGAGLLGLTRHLAFDYGPRGVRVNAICPGGVDTPLLRAGRAHENAEERSTRLAAYGYFMPIKRVSTPDEQAAAIAFLASDDASYINGVSLDVNGGLYMA